MRLCEALSELTERGAMDIVKEIMKELGEKDTNSIYLREIALLMEENEELKGEVRKREKEIKNLLKYMKGKSNAK